MLNQSADYALRAVLFLARSNGTRAASADRIARALGVPPNYMGKVLNALARAHVLESVRGPRGGFRLARDPAQVTLEAVIGPFQGLKERRVCLLGDRPCTEDRPCDVHQRWRHMADPVTAFFRGTTVAGLLEPLAPAQLATSLTRLAAGLDEAGSTEPHFTLEACE